MLFPREVAHYLSTGALSQFQSLEDGKLLTDNLPTSNFNVYTTDDWVIVGRTSMLSKKFNVKVMKFTLSQFKAWQDKGAMIQDTFPHLSPAEREFLMTGSTTEDWDAAFGSDKEEDWEEKDHG